MTPPVCSIRSIPGDFFNLFGEPLSDYVQVSFRTISSASYDDTAVIGMAAPQGLSAAAAAVARPAFVGWA